MFTSFNHLKVLESEEQRNISIRNKMKSLVRIMKPEHQESN